MNIDPDSSHAGFIVESVALLKSFRSIDVAITGLMVCVRLLLGNVRILRDGLSLTGHATLLLTGSKYRMMRESSLALSQNLARDAKPDHERKYL